MMIKYHLCLFLLFVVSVCKCCEDPSTLSVVCRKLKTGGVIVDEIECRNFEHCCWFNSTCFLNPDAPIVDNGINMNNIEKRFLKLLEGHEVQERLFPLGGNVGVPTGERVHTATEKCSPFPANCRILYASMKEMMPSVDIPYCQRIPCLTNNPNMETNAELCLTTPGCVFDNELSRYRSTLNQAVLPTVPVCHMAIRNRVFQRKAAEFLQKGGLWNPLLTECLINENREEIFENSARCKMITMLEYFGYEPKRAGWKGISTRDCHLIDGCWRPDKGCVYPVGTDDINVRSSNDQVPTVLPNEFLFGQPECLPFDSSNDAAFLASYHKCLSTGCATSVSGATVTKHLYGAGNSHLPTAILKYRYYAKLRAGEVRADNWQEIVNEILATRHNSRADALALYRSLTSLQQINEALAAPVNPNPLLSYSLNTNTSSVKSALPITNGLATRSNPRTFDTNLILMESLVNRPVPSNPMMSSLKKIIPTSQRYCPYQGFQLNTLPPLSGSFEGCCERPLCYVPRSSVYQQRSGVSSYKGEWNAWTKCSKSCLGGTQRRSRPCIGKDCVEIADEVRSCNEHQCPSWLSWGEYNSCSRSCAGGVQVRSRECSTYGQCLGPGKQTKSCRTGACPTMSDWSQWTVCSEQCGVGIRTRNRTCTSGGAYGCPDMSDEVARCVRYCGNIQYRDSLCDPVTCLVTRTPVCLQSDGTPGYCRRDRMQSFNIRCYSHNCFCYYFPNRYPCNIGMRFGI
ncbi:uncharacterized protein LOC100175335 [Ciona intestinalis]